MVIPLLLSAAASNVKANVNGRGHVTHPADVAELQEVVRADLTHLRDTWRAGMDLHALRREAASLRRLLVDNGGDVFRLWRAQGRAGQPLIPEVSDLCRFPSWKGLGFATADTVQLGDDLELGELLLWKEDEITPEIRAVLESEQQASDMPLKKYLEAPCVIVNERPIRRDDFITYVANRRGGAHLDRRGRTKNPRRQAAFELLDSLSAEGFQVNRQDATFAQLIAIARNIVTAPDLQPFMQ